VAQRIAILLAAGVLLHAYTATFHAEGGWGARLGLFAWSCSPYVICAVIAFRLDRPAAALGGAALALAADLLVHVSVFVDPQSSTAGLGLLFMPLWNLLIVVPIGTLIGWLIGRAAAQP
jgi:hypothetical protein